MMVDEDFMMSIILFLSFLHETKQTEMMNHLNVSHLPSVNFKHTKLYFFLQYLISHKCRKITQYLPFLYHFYFQQISLKSKNQHTANFNNGKSELTLTEVPPQMHVEAHAAHQFP